MVNYTFSATVLQPESVTYDPLRLISAIQNVSIVDRLFPTREMDLLDLQYATYALGTKSAPEVVADIGDKTTFDRITSQKKLTDIFYIEDYLRFTDVDWERMQRDPANFDANLAALGYQFGLKRNQVGLGGNTDPAISGLLTTARGTDAALTNKDATDLAGWKAMIAELESDLRTNILGYYNTVSKWILMTSDVYTLGEALYFTYDETKTIIDWLKEKYNGQVFVDNHFGETTPGGNDGTQCIMLGIYHPEFQEMIQTPINSKNISMGAGEVRYRFTQHYTPICHHVEGFHWENGVTVS
jgi:hypothetical protein